MVHALNTPNHSGTPHASRRGFLKLAIGIVTAIVGLLLAIPFVAALIAPTYRRGRTHLAKVGEVSPLPPGEPVSLTFQSRAMDAFIRQTDTHEVWVVKHSDSDLTVFSPICPHLGCHYDWVPSGDQFVCPCHNSHFSITGEVLSGPAPRPLDTLPYRIENGVLYVKWERFQAGVPEKIRV
jgi:menaquinol-cytochrome c reductase iron-sulfur subunit